MTTKEFLIKSSYDDAGMKKFKEDCDDTLSVANNLELGLSNDAKVIEQNITQSMNAAGDRVRTVTSLLLDQGRIAKVSFSDFSDGTRKISGSFQQFSETVIPSLSKVSLGMGQLSQDAQKTTFAARTLGVDFANTAKVIDQNVSVSVNKAGESVRTVTSILEANGKTAKVAFQDTANATKILSASFVSLKSATKEVSQNLGYVNLSLNKLPEDTQKAAFAARGLGQDFSNVAKVINQEVRVGTDKAGNSFRTVTAIMEGSGKTAKVVFQDTATGTKVLSSSFQALGSASASLEQNMGRLLSRALLTIPIWESLRFGIQSVERVLSESVKFLVDWETQMARVRLVTGASKEEIDSLSDSLLHLSEKLGISTTEISDSANEWLRMGATMKDVLPLLEQTGKLSLISGKTMEESAKSINILRSAFHMNAEEVSKSLDKLIGIQSASGVSLEVLLEGFDKASIKAHQMGVTFDQLAGYIAAVNQRSRQTGEAIGTQLNMMFNRMGTNAVQLAQNLSGVAFYLDSTGKATTQTTQQMRNTNDILRDLSANWNNLSNTQQNALAKTLGSARQVTTFIALMENYSNAVKASSTAAGEAQKDLSTVTDTTANKVKQLSAAWDIFINKIGNTAPIKGAIDSTKEFIIALTQLTQIASHPIKFLFTRHSLVNPKTGEEENPGGNWTGSYGKLNEDKQQFETKNNGQKSVVSSLLSEEVIREKIVKLQENANITGEDKVSLLQKEINLWQHADGLSQKIAVTQINALQVKLSAVEAQERLNVLTHNEADYEEQMREEGASKLEIDIQHLAFLKETGALQKTIDSQQKTVDIETEQLQKSIQDQIVSALVDEQKTLGETNLQQIQNKISLEDQLGIHLQGVDLLKQQLDLYKAITDESKKTTQEKQKELQDLIKKTPAPEKTGFGTSFRNERNEQRLTQEALKRGISQDTIDSILHPNLKSGTGGVNSLQDELKKSLSDPLGSNIHNLANTISRLADAIEHPNVGPNLTSGQRYVAPGSPITVGQTHTNQPTSTLSQSLQGKNVSVDLGGINVTVHAHTKKELQGELNKIMQELISNHMVQPGSKMNKAIKDVIEKF